MNMNASQEYIFRIDATKKIHMELMSAISLKRLNLSNGWEIHLKRTEKMNEMLFLLVGVSEGSRSRMTSVANDNLRLRT